MELEGGKALWLELPYISELILRRPFDAEYALKKRPITLVVG